MEGLIRYEDRFSHQQTGVGGTSACPGASAVPPGAQPPEGTKSGPLGTCGSSGVHARRGGAFTAPSRACALPAPRPERPGLRPVAPATTQAPVPSALGSLPAPPLCSPRLFAHPTATASPPRPPRVAEPVLTSLLRPGPALVSPPTHASAWISRAFLISLVIHSCRGWRATALPAGTWMLTCADRAGGGTGRGSGGNRQTEIRPGPGKLGRGSPGHQQASGRRCVRTVRGEGVGRASAPGGESC